MPCTMLTLTPRRPSFSCSAEKAIAFLSRPSTIITVITIITIITITVITISISIITITITVTITSVPLEAIDHRLPGSPMIFCEPRPCKYTIIVQAKTTNRDNTYFVSQDLCSGEPPLPVRCTKD